MLRNIVNSRSVLFNLHKSAISVTRNYEYDSSNEENTANWEDHEDFRQILQDEGFTAANQFLRKIGKRPTSQTCLTLVNYFLSNNNPNKAILTIRKYHENNIPLNFACYKRLFMHYYKQKDNQEILKMVDELKAKNIEIPLPTLVSLLRVYKVVGDDKSFMNTWEKIREIQTDLNIPSEAYDEMLGFYSRKKNKSAISELLSEMSEKNILATEHTFLHCCFYFIVTNDVDSMEKYLTSIFEDEQKLPISHYVCFFDVFIFFYILLNSFFLLRLFLLL